MHGCNPGSQETRAPTVHCTEHTPVAVINERKKTLSLFCPKHHDKDDNSVHYLLPHNKLPQNWWLKTTNADYLAVFLRIKNPKAAYLVF
jgi:hypothetical protein